MTVFFQGSEQDAIRTEVGVGTYTDATGGVSESPYTRGGVTHSGNDNGFMYVGSGEVRTECYYHFFTSPSGSNNVSTDDDVVELLNQADVVVMRFTISSGTLTTCTIAIETWDGAAFVDSGYNIYWVEDTNGPDLRLDIYVNADGRLGVYKDSETVCELTGVWDGGTTGFKDLKVRRNRRNRSISQCIESDVPMLDARLWTIAATADGTDTDGAGGYDNINDLTINDSVVTSLGAAEKRSYKATARTITSDIFSVSVAGRLRSSAGGESAKPYLKIGGTRYYGDTFALSTGFSPYQYVWDLNPATAAAWTPSEANDANMEWGWEVV